jgi:hypothetical protein
MRFTYGLDQSLEGQVRPRSLAPRAFHSPPPRAETCPSVEFFCDAEFRRHRLRNFPDGVWIFDHENSIGRVERIAEAIGSSNFADSVPTFLNAPRPAAGSLRDWPDTVWLFAAPPKAVGERPTEFRDTVA